MNGWGILFMTFSTLLIVGLIVGGIVFAARQTGTRAQPMPPALLAGADRSLMASAVLSITSLALAVTCSPAQWPGPTGDPPGLRARGDSA